MQRQRGELVSIGDALSDLGGPVKAIREASPQALHHFTRFDQVNQLVSASEADPDRGFMARTMVLCSLPRSNPGNRKEYVRRNGPYKLGMTAGIDNKLPYGNLPRLILAWVCTEAVRTQSRVLVLGRSLSKFMKTLGINSTSGGRLARLAGGADDGAVVLAQHSRAKSRYSPHAEGLARCPAISGLFGNRSAAMGLGPGGRLDSLSFTGRRGCVPLLDTEYFCSFSYIWGLDP